MPSTITEGSSSNDSSDVDGCKIIRSNESDEVSGYTWQGYDS